MSIPAMLTHSAPNLDAISGDWVMEPKLDGWRWQIVSDVEGVHSVAGRNGSKQYAAPPIEGALAWLPEGTILDGELLPAEHGHQSTKVPTLLARGGHGLRYVVFDVLMVAGHYTMNRPLRERRLLLERLANEMDHDLVTIAMQVPVDAIWLNTWLQHGYEGAMVKDPESVYLPGARTRRWLKIKPQQTADAIITGFEPGRGKFADQVGALRLQMVDTGVTTTASGMDDGTRRDMTDHPDHWLGRRIEIAHHGLHPVSRVPRHPQYKRLREDLEVA